MVICLELGADLHMTQLMPLPLTVSCFSKIQIGFNLLVPAHLGSPRKRAVKQVCGIFWLWHSTMQLLPAFGSHSWSGVLSLPPQSPIHLILVMKVRRQLAQCRFPGLAISNAKILIYFSSKIYGSNFIKQHSETVTVWNYWNADCS